MNVGSHGEVAESLGVLFRISSSLPTLATVVVSASCLVGVEQTIKAFLPIISVPLWWLSALGLVVVLVVVILVALVPILVVVSVLRVAALVIIIIVSPGTIESVFAASLLPEYARTGRRSMGLVQHQALREAGLHTAGSDRNSPGRHCSKVDRGHRRPRRGSHLEVEAGGPT